MRTLIRVAGFVAVLAGGAQAAEAAGVYTDGTTTYQIYVNGGPYIDFDSPAELTTTNRVEFVNYRGVTIYYGYLSDNAITFNFLDNVTFGPSVTSLDQDGLFIDYGAAIFSGAGVLPIASAEVDPTSSLGSSGFSNSNITFNSGAVALSWAGLHFDRGNSIVVRVNGLQSSVPEPATWAMMVAGFLATGLALRRRRPSALARQA